ncbi:hypothetical protein [Niallia taxi]|uniref:hypothetical protein n=1 Tax=Niallia taxi TaxID=2499688 RepID=UPI002E1D4DB4|nr:hypothetical protein [Niallia taxi]
MKLNKIRFSSEICLTKLNDIAGETGYHFDSEEKKDHLVLRFNKQDESDGIIRLYETKRNGQTLDGSTGNKEVNDLILTLFSERFCQGEDSRIESKTAIYQLEEGSFDDIKEVITSCVNKNSYILNDREVPDHVYYMVEVSHSIKQDRVTISQFQSGKLMIQGRSWEVWDEICNSIDESLDVPMEEMLIRLMSKAGTSVTDVVTSSLKSDGEEAIQNRLGGAFDFLYEHDKKLVTSSQCMLISAVDYGDYYCYVAPCLRVLEGYLKKVIVDLGLFTDTEIEEVNPNGSPKFNFGWIFNGTTSLQPQIKTQLGADAAIIAQKESALLRVYREYKRTRNPLQHDGPPLQRLIETYDAAESYFDQIVGVIRSSYYDLF